mmetsp:Transcript_120240/g.299946  ORF Transcript_120240/g.299946 Transcript_120240/m.299946 type:complete len:203 (+) Transcript_120240:1087-1695(+)
MTVAPRDADGGAIRAQGFSAQAQPAVVRPQLAGAIIFPPLAQSIDAAMGQANWGTAEVRRLGIQAKTAVADEPDVARGLHIVPPFRRVLIATPKVHKHANMMLGHMQAKAVWVPDLVAHDLCLPDDALPHGAQGGGGRRRGSASCEQQGGGGSGSCEERRGDQRQRPGAAPRRRGRGRGGRAEEALGLLRLQQHHLPALLLQ